MAERTRLGSVACEHARRLASAAMDEPLGVDDAAALAAHRSGCADCRRFATQLDRLRQGLRVEEVGEVPDIAARVREQLPRRDAGEVRIDRRVRGAWSGTLGRAAALFLVAFSAGALFVGLTSPRGVLASDLAERVLDAQRTVAALSADLDIVERGWHPEVDERRYRGHLVYEAPERLLVRLDDVTPYPPGWRGNDVVLAVDEQVAWWTGRAGCPPALLPECAPEEPRTTVVDEREPFTDGAVPTDIVVPARSFAGAAEPPDLGTRRIEGREAIGVEVTAAQLDPLLTALVHAGDWRQWHPSDRVELWLDAEHFVPLHIAVLPADGTDRERWAATHGYDDPVDLPLLEVRLHGLTLNDAVAAVEIPGAPAHGALRRGGFVDAEPGALAPVPGWLPEGMETHRSGVTTVDEDRRVGVRSWSDGRAWVRLRATRDWAGGRLFGDLPGVPRRVELTGGGVVYLAEGGRKLALHTAETDVVVEGTVPTEELLRIAASLDLTGSAVPTSWAEAATATLDEAAAELPGLLVPAGLEGFGRPGVRVEDDTVRLGYHGPGDRAFLLVQAPGTVVSPPVDDDVRGVGLRGTAARYTPARGELEWVEGGRTVSLRSRTLSLEELVAVAETLEPAGETGVGR